MPSKREGRAVRLNRSMAAILPKDWVRWNEIGPGTVLEIEYNGDVVIHPPLRTASAGGGRSPTGTASRPAQPAETDERALADAGG